MSVCLQSSQDPPWLMQTISPRCSLIFSSYVGAEDEAIYRKAAQQSRRWMRSCMLANEPNAVTLNSSGVSPMVQLKNLKNKQISAIVTGIHASRAIAGATYWTWVQLPNNARIQIVDKEGSQIFTTNG